ncbi:MAG TPA: GMC oxidoreductase [Polyangiaceae bacterium]|nr:GMC oxidoreductase [Polyangiaceae bacterium]
MARTWDVVVVGAGPAGCVAADRLASRGHRVSILDAGPRLPNGARVPEVDRRAWSYSTVGSSFDWYRVRAIGGRGLLWGGWAYRFPERVLRRGGWPYGVGALADVYAELEARLGVVEGTLDERYGRVARALGLRIAPKRAPLAGGKIWTPLMGARARHARPWTAALRVEHEKRRARFAHVLDLRAGSARRLSARAFVLAASPIETARILLESDVDTGGRIGRGLVDHMVASYLLLEPRPPPSADGRGPFPGSALVESFVNTSRGTTRSYRGAFSIELTGPVSLESLGIERMVPGAEQPSWSATLIHALGEVFPHRRRYVDLDPDQRDALGRRVPRIHLAWTAQEKKMAADMKRACVHLADALGIQGSRLVPFVDPLQPGAGHEAGTCAMGRDESAPCDPHGRLRALDNVWIADASATPTAGDRHPTLTVLAHAMRAADSVSVYLAGADASRPASDKRGYTSTPLATPTT